MAEGQQNQWGVMRWADFCACMTVRQVVASDLPVPGTRSSARFVEELTKFRAQLRPGDELYHFNSDKAHWNRGMGSEGFAILRDGELLNTLVVRMN